MPPIETPVSREDFDELRADVKEIKRYFVGNGTPGVFIRIDRLESFQRGVTDVTRWLLGVLAVETIAAITFIGAVLTHTVSIHFGP